MKVLLAPDSFKESLSALDVITALKKGILNVDKTVEIVEFPMADGGEGTIESLVHATNGKTITLKAHDPLMREIDIYYGVLGDAETCVIEIAQVIGLHLVTGIERNPANTSSFGVGEIILHALDNGYRKFIICLGGSATNDGGVGLLKALGVDFLNRVGQSIFTPGGLFLNEIHKIDCQNFDSRIVDCEFTIASDVQNPLLGNTGATYVFGKQKGANIETLDLLEKGMKNFSDIIFLKTQKAYHLIEGAGAAGGLSFTFLSFFNATIRSGIDLVLKYCQFENYLHDADLIITGEGRTDYQTKYGKVASGIAKVGKKYNVPTIIISGSTEKDIDELYEDGVLSIFSIMNKPMPFEHAVTNASILLSTTAEQVFRTFQYTNFRKFL